MVKAIKKALRGSKGSNNKPTVTNSMDPAKMVRLINIGYRKLNPIAFMYMP